jgi:hypothetical protein
MSTVTYTSEQVITAVRDGTDMVDALTDAIVLTYLAEEALDLLSHQPQPFTRASVAAALNSAADWVRDHENPDGGETSDSIWADDVLNLAVNAVSYVLEHPDADLRAVIAWAHKDTELDPSDEEDLPEGTLKGSEAWNDALYDTVTGWIS